MRKHLLAGAAASALFAAPAFAQDGAPGGWTYLQVHLGASFVTEKGATVEGVDFDGSPLSFTEDLDYDAGFAFGGLIGYQVTPNLAVEGEITGRANDFEGNISDEDLTVTTFLANAVLSAPQTGSLIPYVGGGIGFASSNLEEAGNAFAYQAKAGVRVPFGVTQSVGLEAAYVGTGGFEDDFTDEFGDPARYEVDYGGASVMLTYRFDLG